MSDRCTFCYGPCRYAGAHPRTVNNAQCGLRLALRYRVLHARGIGLTDFSTDAHVASYAKRIEDLAADVEAGRPVDGLPDEQRAAYAADLRVLLRRVPAARVTGATARKSEGTGKARDEIEEKVKGGKNEGGGWW